MSCFGVTITGVPLGPVAQKLFFTAFWVRLAGGGPGFSLLPHTASTACDSAMPANGNPVPPEQVLGNGPWAKRAAHESSSPVKSLLLECIGPVLFDRGGYPVPCQEFVC